MIDLFKKLEKQTGAKVIHVILDNAIHKIIQELAFFRN
jgi:hypothetical protein